MCWPLGEARGPAAAGAMDPIEMSLPMRAAVCGCMAAVFYLGIFPSGAVAAAEQAVAALKF